MNICIEYKCNIIQMSNSNKTNEHLIQYKLAQLYNTNDQLYNTNEHLYNTNEQLYNTKEQLSNTNEHLYNTNEQLYNIHRSNYTSTNEQRIKYK